MTRCIGSPVVTQIQRLLSLFVICLISFHIAVTLAQESMKTPVAAAAAKRKVGNLVTVFADPRDEVLVWGPDQMDLSGDNLEISAGVIRLDGDVTIRAWAENAEPQLETGVGPPGPNGTGVVGDTGQRQTVHIFGTTLQIPIISRNGRAGGRGGRGIRGRKASPRDK